ncbi:MAG: peptidoglycan editing factor PgeF [Candidatus Abyssobacteria bacterium SURF_5]|uniref:Purine nucleoside phosphorylase n=1 Tax=Abyssobacteria bacterium (strain SURF_5) TaxID=2093360 RepID=A0A3A4NT93_ABYX5|nr:MAG: peptidoglycan editing factor PgeF [Candidatus Abyssubacteria bacterium SURF_5]
MTNNPDSIVPAFPSEPPFDRIAAGFTTRQTVKKNPHPHEAEPAAHDAHELRRAACEALGLDLHSFTSGKQVHGKNVVLVTESERGRGALDYYRGIPETDALVTDMPGVPIGVFTADCVPVFLYDPATPAVGIVHAGWRSTAKSIVALAVQRMISEFRAGPRNIWAAIGPSIGQCCYEVGRDVYDEFNSAFAYGASLFEKNGARTWRLDLWQANRMQLLETGVPENQIISHDLCTFCNSDRFFSARKHGAHSGRILSLIALRT